MNRSCLRLILLLTLTLAGCDGAREPAPETQRPALDYSWVATTPRAELAGHFDRANVFIYRGLLSPPEGLCQRGDSA